MFKRHNITVVQEGITKTQPYMGVSSTYPVYVDGVAYHKLNLYRVYQDMPNKHGRGVFKYADANGKLFKTDEEVTKFCLEYGYTRQYFNTELRKQRKLRGKPF